MAVGRTATAHGPSEAIENYAKAIYALEERGGGAVSNNDARRAHERDARVGVGHGARSSTSSASSTHVPYKGVQLTTDGRRVALEVLRHHRLLELYLAESLGVPWDRVHDEAEVLEHVLSEELEALIAAKLGNPTRDPHGDPIPDAGPRDRGGRRPSASRTLEPGARGRFVRVSDSDPRCCATWPSAASRPARASRWWTSSRSAAR